jgi:hypothetical protein
MGLLDSMDDPRTMGLLSLGMGLLNSRGNFGQALGQAGPQALQAVRQVQEDRQKKAQREQAQQMQALQMQQAQAAMAQQQAQQQRQAAIEGAYRGALRSPEQMAMAGGGGPSVANAAAIPNTMPQIDQSALIRNLMQADPMAAYQMLQPKPEDMKVVGDALVGVTGGKARELYRAPQKPEPLPGNVREFQYGQENPAFNEWLLRQNSAKGTKVRVDAGQRFENAYSTNQGKEFSDTMAGINKTAFAAPAQIRKLERMEQLLDGVDGGKLAPTGLDIASAANSIGIKIDPKLGNKEAAQALAREIAGGFRQPGTGPMTDKDFENFLLQVPDLSKTAQGRKQITATMKAAASRDIQIAKLARDYEKKNGKLDNGFLDEAAQYIAENPVVGMPSGWKVRQ